MKRLHFLPLAALLVLVGCSGAQLQQAATKAQPVLADAQQVTIDLKAIETVANKILATSPTSQPGITATTQKIDSVLDKVNQATAGLSAAVQQIQQNPNASGVLAGAQAVNAAIPNPYTGVIAVGLGFAGIVLTSIQHRKATQSIVQSTSDLTSAVAEAHTRVAQATADVAAAQAATPAK